MAPAIHGHFARPILGLSFLTLSSPEFFQILVILLSFILFSLYSL